ncbi:hypothetical protein [Pseudorhodoferax aquiterrae]|uniref:hypothetical protein n=1 Tax=Pseudorhodoferax aquiterrae TaxID=747304 RepID=UPI001672A78C|nr:hypothetical protein [Pseudorhodoferax aquiterrae]
MTSSEFKRRFDFTHACSKRIRLPEYALGAAADKTLAFSSRGRDSSTLLQCVGNLCRQASKISMLLRPLGFADRKVRDRDAIVSTHAFGPRLIRALIDIPGQAERVVNREVRADDPANWGAGERGSGANSRAVALRLPRQACKAKLFHLLVDTRPHRCSETCCKCCLDDLEGAVMSDSPSDREDQILRLCLIVASDEVGAAFDEREAMSFVWRPSSSSQSMQQHPVVFGRQQHAGSRLDPFSP